MSKSGSYFISVLGEYSDKEKLGVAVIKDVHRAK